MQSRFWKIRRVLIAILALNWAVAAAKIFYGHISRCTAMSADGFHSFSDGTSNIIGLIGVWVASRPIDKEHPYGHKKYETFTAIVIAIMLFIISFELIKGGLLRFIHPVVPDVTPASFFIMGITIIINTCVFMYERGRSKQLQSDILAADSQHTRSDILVSVSVIFTLLAVRSGFPMIDTIVSIGIALFIAHAAFGILKDSSDILCDRNAMVSDKIRRVVVTVPGVQGCHKIRTRGRPDDIHMDLHILVAPDMAVDEAHRLNDDIEKAIRKDIAGVTDIAIHIEPDNRHEKNMAY